MFDCFGREQSLTLILLFIIYFQVIGYGVGLYIYRYLHRIPEFAMNTLFQPIDPLPAVPAQGDFHDLLHLHDDVPGNGEIHCSVKASLQSSLQPLLQIFP